MTDALWRCRVRCRTHGLCFLITRVNTHEESARSGTACQVTVTAYIPHACDTSSAAMATVGGGAVPSQWDVSFNQNVMNYAWAPSHLMRLMTERSHDLIKLQLLGSEWHLVFIHPIIHQKLSLRIFCCFGRLRSVSSRVFKIQLDPNRVLDHQQTKDTHTHLFNPMILCSVFCDIRRARSHADGPDHCHYIPLLSKLKWNRTIMKFPKKTVHNTKRF